MSRAETQNEKRYFTRDNNNIMNSFTNQAHKKLFIIKALVAPIRMVTVRLQASGLTKNAYHTILIKGNFFIEIHAYRKLYEISIINIFP